MNTGDRKLSQDYAVGSGAQEKCQQWVESSEFATISNDDVASLSGHSTEFISTVADSDISSIADDVANINITEIDKGNELKIVSNTTNVTDINHTEILQTVFQGNSTQTFGNIQIENSNNIHIGIVTYVTGPIHIIHTNGNNLGSVQQIITTAKTTPAAPATHVPSSDGTSKEPTWNGVAGEGEIKKTAVEEVERNRDDVFVSNVCKANRGLTERS